MAPPQGSVIVEESATVSYSAGTSNNGQSYPGSGSAQLDGQMTQTGDTPGLGSDTKQGVYWHASGGSSISLTDTPSANGSITAQGYGGVSASVKYSASVSPVTINPVGATPDGSGGWDILVGQGCAPVLNGIPSGTGWQTTYQWKVSGTTFQKWLPATPANPNATPPTQANPDASYYSPGPGPLNGPAPAGPGPNGTPAVPSPSWFWNDAGNGSKTTETITCTATVTPPAGQGSAFTVTATQKVNVYVPFWDATGAGGTMQVNPFEPAGNGSDYWLWAGPISGIGRGMTWNAKVSSPLPKVFGDGIIDIAQLITPFWSYQAPNSSNVITSSTWSLNGQQGLDSVFPYGWAPPTPPYVSGDSPGLDLTSKKAVSAVVKPQFKDYLMYEPPGSSQYVPLANFTWSTHGSAAIPGSGSWADFGSVSAGPIIPSGKAVEFTQDNSFPSWTQNDDISRGHFSP